MAGVHSCNVQGIAPSSGGDASQVERALHRTLTYRLHVLHKMTDMESQRRYLAEARLSLGEGRCLATIGSVQPVSVNDLARASNLNKAQASRAAQALVEKSLVEKTIDPQDGRGVVLRLTPEGQRRWQVVMTVIRQRNEEIVACLNDAEREMLSQLFDRLIAHAEFLGAADSS
jgi:Transcriptional regulators